MSNQKLVKYFAKLSFCVLIGINLPKDVWAYEYSEMFVNKSINHSNSEKYTDEYLPIQMVGVWKNDNNESFEITSENIIKKNGKNYKIKEYFVDAISDTTRRYTLLFDENVYRKQYKIQEEKLNLEPFVFEFNNKFDQISYISSETNKQIYKRDTIAEVSETSLINNETSEFYRSKQKLVINFVRPEAKIITGTVEPLSTVMVNFKRTGDKISVDSDEKGFWTVEVPSSFKIKEGDILDVTATTPNLSTDYKQVKVPGFFKNILPRTGESRKKSLLISGLIFILLAYEQKSHVYHKVI